VQEKIKLFDQLESLTHSAWDPHSGKLDTQASLLKTELKNLADNMNKSIEDDRKVEERLSQIDFPFGQLPATLDEAISIFPISMAVGSLICNSIIVDTIKLRRELLDYYIQKYISKGIRDKSPDISNIAPLWIDPVHCKQQQILKFFILSIPFIIFVASCFLIFFEWLLIDPALGHRRTILTFPGGTEINHIVFTTMYTISAGLFFYGYRRIMSELNA
jgi:hypothetical protein